MADDVLQKPEAGGRVIRGSAVRIAGYGSGILLSAGASILLLRHLGVIAMGQYVTVMSIVAVAGAIAEAGMSAVATRELSVRAPGRDRTALLVGLLGLRLLITPVGVGLAVGFAWIAGYTDEMVLGTLLAGSGLLLVMVQATMTVTLTVELRNGLFTLIELVKQLVTVVGIAVLVAVEASLLPFFAVQIAVGVAALVTCLAVMGPAARLRPRFAPSAWSGLLREALPVAIAFVLGTLYFRVVVVVMSLRSDDLETGYFGTSLRVLETLAGVPLLVAGIALPVLSAAAATDRKRLDYAMERMTDVGLLLGVLGVVGAYFAAEDVLVLIGGDEYRPAADVLRIQMVALLFIFLSQIWAAALLALRRQRALIWINLIALATVVATAVPLVSARGAEGGALATVIGDVVLAVLVLAWLRRDRVRVGLAAGLLARVAGAAAVAFAVPLAVGLDGLAGGVVAALLFALAARVAGAVPAELAGAFRLPSRDS